MNLASAAPAPRVSKHASLARAGVVLLPVFLVVQACVKAESTRCDGFANRKLAVTGAEYQACAGEILAALDALEPPLRAVAQERASREEQEAARQAYARLRMLIRRTGMERDFMGDSGTIAMKWPEAAVQGFNRAAFHAAVQYGSALGYPNEDNFDQGSRAHDDARRYYYAIR